MKNTGLFRGTKEILKEHPRLVHADGGWRKTGRLKSAAQKDVNRGVRKRRTKTSPRVSS